MKASTEEGFSVPWGWIVAAFVIALAILILATRIASERIRVHSAPYLSEDASAETGSAN